MENDDIVVRLQASVAFKIGWYSNSTLNYCSCALVMTSSWLWRKLDGLTSLCFTVIDDINFVPAHLEPYLEKAVQLIFKVNSIFVLKLIFYISNACFLWQQTVADIAESETNIQIIQIISVLIVQMGELVYCIVLFSFFGQQTTYTFEFSCR